MVVGPKVPKEIWTERLLLRRWRPEDRDPFASMNADPEVMEFFPAPLSRAESDELVDRIEGHFASKGYGLWAVEVLGGAPFGGFVGLNPADLVDVGFPADAVEVGWRLDKRHWGRGFATEAAAASLQYGFDRLGLPEVVSCTSTANTRSQRVMKRIGLTRDAADDFDHPRVPNGSPLKRHVLYRTTAADWHDRQNGGRARSS